MAEWSPVIWSEDDPALVAGIKEAGFDCEDGSFFIHVHTQDEIQEGMRQRIPDVIVLGPAHDVGIRFASRVPELWRRSIRMLVYDDISRGIQRSKECDRTIQ